MNNTIKYEIEDKKLKLINSESEKIVTFNFPIRQVVSFRDCYIVRIEPDIGQVDNENIFGVSSEGNILWQIEPMLHVYKDSPYTGVSQEGDLAKLCNWDGTDLIIAPYTGKIIKQSYSK
jgi:hypothetical protein